MPAVRILDNVQLDANAYVIKIKEVEAGTGQVWPNQFMVMDPTGGQHRPARHPHHRADLRAAGDLGRCRPAAKKPRCKAYTVVDAATVLATHLTELIKANMSDLLSYAEVQKLLKELPKDQGELVKDIVPAQISITGIQRVLQMLLAERISIRDLSTILEGIADGVPFTRNPATLAEHVRARLARQLCAQHTSPAGYLPLIALSAQVGTGFRGVDGRPGRRPPARHAAVEALRVHHAGARRASSRPHRKAKRRCWSPRPASARSCARSSSASARRRRCCRRRKFIRARG